MKQQVTKAGNLLATAYMLIMFVLYPFYMKNGYTDLGEAKYHFFFYVTTAAVSLLLILAVVRLILGLLDKKAGKKAHLFSFDRISGVDLLVLLYLSEAFVSFAFSGYKKEAFFGTEGWYMGFATILLAGLVYFLIGAFWKDTIKMYAAPIIASCLVFLLAILNRFSVYLPFQEAAGGEFISTLGNINWFCGYFSVIAPIGATMYFLWSTLNYRYRMDPLEIMGQETLAVILLILTYTAAFCQGSNSIFLVIAAEVLFLVMIGVEGKLYLMQIPIFLFTIGGGMTAAGLLRQHMPDRFNYELDPLTAAILDPENGMWICLFAIVTGIFCCRESWRKSTVKATFVRGLLLGVICFMMLILPATVFLYMAGRLPGMEQAGAAAGLFAFNEDWGNGRGAAMMSAVYMFKEMSPMQKLFGVGPDCFSAFAYASPSLSAYLFEKFGNARLTNAHNELLTMLVNTGITGVILYYTMMIVFIRRCIINARKDILCYIPAACVVGYLIHNIVSFSQVLSFPYVFLLMGMERAMERRLDKY